MAHDVVTGWTAEKVARKRAEFEERHKDNPEKSFDKAYCLAKIPRQPDDYDGPQRYCAQRDTSPFGSNWICDFHGGDGETQPEHMEKLAPMKHGMRALRKHVRQDFSDKDEALYNWIIEEYPAAYGIDIEESPADAYDIHRLAVEIVRAERGREHLLREGEIHEEEKVGEQGLVVDENGEVVTELSQHYLAGMMDRQDRKITKLQKELGITRKERQKRDTETSAVEAMQSFGELGKAFLSRDDKDYDPDNKPWEADEEDENG